MRVFRQGRPAAQYVTHPARRPIPCPPKNTARIKINRLLEARRRRFSTTRNGPANVALEPNVKITCTRRCVWRKLRNPFAMGSSRDFCCTMKNGFPLAARSQGRGQNPLVGKEQARRYAREQNCRYVILSNGNLHYLGRRTRQPHLITQFPTAGSIQSYRCFQPDPRNLATEIRRS